MENIHKHIKQYAKIGIALSAEKNINKLLEMIVKEAMSLSGADAGTLYILDKKLNQLRFEILRNNKMKTKLGGTSSSKITIPAVPLYLDEKPNYTNVSSYVALTGKSVNIPDVYNSKTFDFTGPKKYDKQTGYLSKSMLVIPMKNHEDKIIGVLQLLNAQKPGTDIIISFAVEHEEMIASLASQAAVALNKVQLIKELELLFYAFIRSIATAIDEKSPYTGGHIKRVVGLTTDIANEINKTNKGPFKDIFFNEEEMEELKIAAWLHDVGKITTPEFVIDKMTRLETIFDRINHINTRFKLIKEITKKQFLQKKLDLYHRREETSNAITQLDNECNKALEILENELCFIKECNNSMVFMSDDKLEKINAIAQKKYLVDNIEYPYLSKDELANLSIRKGTLTSEERQVIENHAAMTLKITNQLPFPDHLSNVPKYASAHHEKLDGSGYPLGLLDKDLPIQSRIIGIADIFEALTAHDRPYKEPMKISEAIKILGFMQKNNHIDSDILDLFINSKIVEEYAKNELDIDQLETYC